MTSLSSELTNSASQELGPTERKSILAAAAAASNSGKKCQCCLSVSVQQKLILALVSVLSSLGGLLLGYDFATFTSTVLDNQQYFSISEGWKLAIIYVAPFVASFSALLGAFSSRWLGRRPLVLTGSAIYIVGMILNTAAVNGIMLFVGRTISAIGLGVLITIGPVYVSEVSPAESRGKAVTTQGLLIAIGGFLSFFFVSYLGSMASAWPMRLGFALVGVVAVVMFIGFLFVPESYRWLLRHGYIKKAQLSLSFFLRDPSLASMELDRIQQLIEMPSPGILPTYILTVQTLTLACIVGYGLTIITQLCSTIGAYADKLQSPWVTAGMPAYWVMKILLEITPVVASFIGLLLVDRIGRHWVLVISLGGMTASLLLLFGASTVINKHGPIATPLFNDTCIYTTCGACVTDPGCGYCTDSTNLLYFNGTCSPGNADTSTTSNVSSTSSCTLFQADTFIDPPPNQTEITNVTSWNYFLCPTTNGGYAWFALLSLWAYRVFLYFGIQNILWTVNTEIYPTNSQPENLGIVNTVYLVASGILNSLADADTTLALPYMYLIFTALTLLSTVFIGLLLPETSQKELEEIISLFECNKVNSCLTSKYTDSTPLSDTTSHGDFEDDVVTIN